MLTVIVVIHLLIAISLIALILLQKTEGNAAGGGFSTSSVTAMMQPRARPNPLSRATTILGISFFVTSLGLALLARQNGPSPSILDAIAPKNAASAPKVSDVGPSSAPDSTAPAAPAAASGAPAEPAPAGAAAAPGLGALKPVAPPTAPTVPNN